MPSRISSQAVSRAPCRNGRVSSASTRTFLPASTAPRTTPSAVPYPAVARPPALQCVRIVASAGTNSAPKRPMVWHASRSSRWISRASSSRRAATAALSALRARASAATRRMRSTAQPRLTAVGRARSIRW